MSDIGSEAYTAFHGHVFLGEGHEKSERRTWAVIWLCAAMMLPRSSAVGCSARSR